MTCALKVENVSKSFNSVAAVQDISITVEQGEIFGLVGPNGAGKTTLMRMVMDILRPDSGHIERVGLCGYLPEERGVYVEMKVRAVLEYFARLKGLRPSDARSNASRWLERLDLGAHAGRKVRELSKGNQQKVQFAVAVVANPVVLVLDEPLSGLDPVNVRFFKEIIRELQNQGTSVLLSTHQMPLVEELCSRLLLICRGRAALGGSVQEVCGCGLSLEELYVQTVTGTRR